MRIEHIAIWTTDLEKMKQFYIDFFDMVPNDNYYNPEKEFSSYFLSSNDGPRIELMHNPSMSDALKNSGTSLGLAHFAIAVGHKDRVDQLTDRLRNAGYEVLGEARTTGDGYYESVVADPEGNQIELTV